MSAKIQRCFDRHCAGSDLRMPYTEVKINGTYRFSCESIMRKS